MSYRIDIKLVINALNRRLSYSGTAIVFILGNVYGFTGITNLLIQNGSCGRIELCLIANSESGPIIMLALVPRPGKIV